MNVPRLAARSINPSDLNIPHPSGRGVQAFGLKRSESCGSEYKCFALKKLTMNATFLFRAVTHEFIDPREGTKFPGSPVSSMRTLNYHNVVMTLPYDQRNGYWSVLGTADVQDIYMQSTSSP